MGSTKSYCYNRFYGLSFEEIKKRCNGAKNDVNLLRCKKIQANMKDDYGSCKIKVAFQTNL